jgi:ABC-2 type transport system ATP-binding protein
VIPRVQLRHAPRAGPPRNPAPIFPHRSPGNCGRTSLWWIARRVPIIGSDHTEFRTAGSGSRLAAIVQVQGLRKVYEGKQRVVALDGIDLGVEEGELFGLLGPNGAGKTTTISICTTRVLPTAGRVHIAGIDVVQSPALARRSIGIVPQFNTLDRACTVYENLHFHCLYFGFSRSEARQRTLQLLEQFHLTERADSYPSQLSGGLAQRVQIARAIAHRPRVLFLDEPSAGLDPQSRIAMWEAVRHLREEGITVVLTTHYMEEADELCDRVAIIDHGSILIEDTPAALKGSVGAQKVYALDLSQYDSTAALLAQLRRMSGVRSAEPTPVGVRVLADNTDGLLPEIVRASNPYGLRDLTITESSLETVFIQLTGRELRE